MCQQKASKAERTRQDHLGYTWTYHTLGDAVLKKRVLTWRVRIVSRLRSVQHFESGKAHTGSIVQPYRSASVKQARKRLRLPPGGRYRARSSSCHPRPEVCDQAGETFITEWIATALFARAGTDNRGFSGSFRRVGKVAVELAFSLLERKLVSKLKEHFALEGAHERALPAE